jgi:hypothetical protein
MPSNKELLYIIKKKKAIRESLFPEQLAFLDDKSHKKALWTTRRAGKTYTVLADFIYDALDHPNSEYAFIAISQTQAEKICVRTFREMKLKFGLNMEIKETKKRVVFPNGAVIQLYGADKPGWANTIYGQKIRKAAIDEAAFYRIKIDSLVDDYIEPATIDENGQVILMSIPGHFHYGIFWDITKNLDYKKNYEGIESPDKKGWFVHRWTTANNPHMAKKFAKKIAELKAENPEIESTATFVRNYLGGWSIELGEKVYKFDEKLNLIDSYERRDDDHYILGIDLGWDDKTALSVCAWNDNDPNFYVLEGHSESAMMLDKLASYVVMYQESYNNLEIVGDSKHKQIFEEFRRRFDFPVYEAERPNKFDWILTVNNDYQNGKILVVKCEDNEQLIKEMAKLIWKTKPNGWKVEQPGMPNDRCDSVLMSYRQAYHYRFEEKPKEIVKGSKEWFDEIENDMISQVEAQFGEGDDYDDL